jgi:WD40 repeat protein
MNINKDIVGLIFDNYKLSHLFDKRPTAKNKTILTFISNKYITKRKRFKKSKHKTIPNLISALPLNNGGLCFSTTTNDIFILNNSMTYIKRLQLTSLAKLIHELDNNYLIVSSSTENIVRVFNGKDHYKSITKLRNTSICCSITQLDSFKFALGFEACNINIYDSVHCFQLIRTITEPSRVLSMVILDDCLISASNIKNLRVHGTKDFCLRKEMKGHNYLIQKVVNLPGKRFASSDPYCVRIWETKYFTNIIVLSDMEKVADMVGLNDGRIVVSSRDQKIHIYDPIEFYMLKGSLEIVDIGFWKISEMRNGILFCFDDGKVITFR